MNPLPFSTKPSLIVYIHGYASSGLSSKARHYQQLFGKRHVYTPSLPTDTRLAVDSLEQSLELLMPNYEVGLIGSSLGGFLALFLANKFCLPAVLINPAIPPWHQKNSNNACLKSINSERFDWLPEHLKRLEPYRVKSLSPLLRSRLLVLQQLDDEVLDAQLALEYLADVACCVSKGGGHRFSNIADYDHPVSRFFQPFLSGMLK
ncbi:YqiA/YcfP family alpha/beta fold hydrolase [Thiomicrospira sp. R3]|uniref:YqiA/YcfP family alpha/beta fold hydrolase n=1 Tax=Thiomicrospira sp. R3 TaxID=3035472 RepID=UPI00259B0BFB|nr:YqiA/YcfP family alpha/beta fold hydrolase [Thiomicrospira sp. R3]WFE68288.1 YqiA/YcfP family alpha/beta fold hydrolase [Thiomicrospira sp. R3]